MLVNFSRKENLLAVPSGEWTLAYGHCHPQENPAMSTITKDVVIPPDRRIVLELPADCPSGQAKITVIIEPDPSEDKPKNTIASLYGKGKGKVWMADDFDAPLEDFKEYM
jgi:hypothetical protein